MRTVGLIAQRELLARVRGRGYLIATLAGIVAIIGLSFAPSLMSALTAGQQSSVLVRDETVVGGQTGSLYPRLHTDLAADTLTSGRERYALAAATGSDADARARLEAGDVDAYLVLRGRPAAGEPFTAAVYTRESLSMIDESRLRAALSSVATFARLQERGLTDEQAAALFAPVPLTATVLGQGPQSEQAAAESWSLTYVLVILLYMTIVLYGTYIAMGVIEEKSTRVVEILVSTVRPFHLMLGKLLGMGAAALLQYGLWLGAGFGLLLARGSLDHLRVAGMDLALADVDPWLLVAFFVFFVLGFCSYAGLFAAGGSLVSRTEDAQQITGPLTMILVVVFFFAFYTMENPDKPLSVALSLVPLVSPMIMFVRIAMGQPEAWQIALSIVLSLVATVLLVAAASRIFRAGVLLYGRRMSMRAVWEALR